MLAHVCKLMEYTETGNEWVENQIKNATQEKTTISRRLLGNIRDQSLSWNCLGLFILKDC